jgi:hypothetical protein
MRNVLIIRDDKIWLETLTASLEAENFWSLQGYSLFSIIKRKIDLC